MYLAASLLTFPNIDPIIFEIGPLALRWYSLAYIVGLVLGWLLAARMMEMDSVWAPGKAPATRQNIDDLLIWAAAGVIVGGRFGYVLFYNLPFYLENPASILQVWEGGMSFHGGFLGVILSVYFFTRRHKLALWSVADVLALVAPIGLFFGRIANFINGELYGRTTDAALGMVFPNGGPLPRHPSQLYEAALEGALLFVVMMILVRAGALRKPGILTGTFFLGYAIARTIVEQFREPDAQIGFLAGGITMGQVLSAPMILVGMFLIIRAINVPERA